MSFLQRSFRIGLAIAGVVLLYLSSLYNYLLFHSIAEIFSVCIAMTVFFVTWNSKSLIKNNYLLLIGIAYLFIGTMDFFHTISYQGMKIFTDYDYHGNQVWIAARYFESIILLLSFTLVQSKRRIHVSFLVTVYSIITALLLLSIFVWRIFPICFIAGVGQTPFKIASEYIIIAILGTALLMLRRNKNAFEANVYRYLFFSIVCTIAQEVCFTSYVSNYGLVNLLGHYFKIIAFYLVYRVMIHTGIREPYNLIFREIKQAEQQLYEQNQALSGQVVSDKLTISGYIDLLKQRQEELAASEKQYRTIVETAGEGIAILRPDGMFLYVNQRMTDMLGYTAEEILGKTGLDFVDPGWRQEIIRTRAELHQTAALQQGELKYRRKDGSELWTLFNVTPMISGAGEHIANFTMLTDITDRKKAEQAYRETSEREAYFLNLSDLLRPLEKPEDILKTGCNLLADYLKTAQVSYFEWNLKEDSAVMLMQTKRGDTPPSPPQKFKPSDNTYLTPTLSAGKIFTISDMNTTTLLSEADRDVFLSFGIVSQTSVPIMKDGSLLASLTVRQETPRIWSASEIALVKETAERTWEALEKANAQLQLSESEERYRSIVETAGEGILLSYPDGSIFYTNQRMADMLGFPVDEIIGKTGMDFVYPEWRLFIQPARRELQRGVNVQNSEFKFRGKDGSELWTLCNSSPMFDNAGNHIANFSMHTDITDRKKAEQAFRESSEREAYLLGLSDLLRPLERPEDILNAVCNLLADYLKTAQVTYLEWDVKADSAVMRMQANRGDLLPSPQRTFKPSGNPFMLSRLASGQVFTISDMSSTTLLDETERDNFLSRRIISQTSIPIVKDGILLASLTVRQATPRMWSASEIALIRETTERTWEAFEKANARQKLRQASAVLTNIINSTEDFIWSVDANYHLLLANSSLQEFMKTVYGTDFITGMPLTDAFSKESAAVFTDLFEKVKQTGSLELDVRNAILSDRVVNHSLHPVFVNSELVEITVFGRDITERMKAEQEIVRINTQLESRIAERTAELQESVRALRNFSLMVTHDLKMPLYEIERYSALIRDGIDAQMNASKVIHACVNMNLMISELLDYEKSSGQAIQKGKVNLKDIFESVYEDYKTEKSALEFATGMPAVMADLKLIRHAAENLISNALKFSSDRETQKIIVACKKEGAEYVFSLKDNGIGIDMEYADKLFNLFERQNNGVFKGHGIGLASVKAIIEKHGGRTWDRR